MKEKVLITGAAGKIGSILRKNLKSEFELYLADKKEMKEQNSFQIDLAEDYEELKKLAKNKDSLIHLAWNDEETFISGISLPENKKMVENVYRAATKSRPRVIMASSVHAAWGYINKDETTKISPYACFPDSPYGATKVWIENLGKYYSTLGLEVMCLRFGDPREKIRNIPEHGDISHRDLSQLVKKCIKTKEVPRFSIFYGVSNDSFYDISNAEEILGYHPRDK